MQDMELLHDLVQESREHLQNIEPDLLELEQNGESVSDELINRVFRAVHSIKGGFGFFGIEKVIQLAHSMENILSRIRDHELNVTKDLTDALLKGIDKLQVMMDDIENTDSIDIGPELETLAPFRQQTVSKESKTDSDGTQKPEESTIPGHPYLDPDQMEKARKSGKFIYNITAESIKDIEERDLTPQKIIENWEKIGEILDITVNLDDIEQLSGSSNKNLTFSIVFASVLEPDLISTGCEIPDNQIELLNKKELSKNDNSKTSDNHNKEQESSKLNETEKKPVHSESHAIDESLRVRVSLLNNLMNLAGELVLSRNQLVQLFNKKLSDLLQTDSHFSDFNRTIEQSITSASEAIELNPSSEANTLLSELYKIKESFKNCFSFPMQEISGINASLQSIDTVTSLLQENIMQTRLQPVSVVFQKFPRVVRDLAHKLGKQINLEMTGQDVELDKSIIELLSDPLTHLVRNSADHGIELPQQRTKAGKNPTGKLELSASQQGGKVIIKVSDDGKGLDSEKIIEHAVTKGVISDQSAANMSIHEIQMLIMAPGFSTAEKISDVSGRGVGMDVVRANIERLGGSIDIESDPGYGTSITLTLPLTLAIIPSLIISTEGRNFAIPQVGVEELVRIRAFEVTSKIERIQNAEVMRLRGKLLPLVRLSELLELQPTFVHPETGERMEDRRAHWSDRRGPDKKDHKLADNRRKGKEDRRENVSNAVMVIVLKSGQYLYGLVVDQVLDNEEIVVKPLPEYLKSTQCYTGATIMGDGKVAMILDPGGIAQKADLRFSDLEDDSINKNQNDLQNDLHEILLFDTGTQERFGLDLDSIVRIETAESKEVELVGNREFLKRDQVTFPLIHIHDFLPVNKPENKSDTFYVLIPRNRRKIGVAVNQVFDVVHSEYKLQTNEIHGSGILGSMIINDRLTIILDMPALLGAVNSNAGVH